MASTLPKLEGLISVETAWTMTVVEWVGASSTTATVTVAPVGDYYLTSSTSLLTTMSAALTANGTLNGTYSCTLDDDTDAATGKVTLSVSGGGITKFTFTYPAGSPAPATTLGLAAQGSGTALTYTGASQAKYLWLPNCHRQNPMSPDGDSGAMESDFTIAVAPSGVTKRLSYNTRYIDNLEFGYLRSSKTWTSDETTTNESLQRFWTDVIYAGHPLRYFPRRDTDATWVTWVAEGGDRFQPEWVIPNWDNASSLMRWQTRVRKYV